MAEGYRFTAHCVCGCSLDIRSGHADVVAFYETMWDKLHPDGHVTDEAHARATPRQAAAARARAVRKVSPVRS